MQDEEREERKKREQDGVDEGESAKRRGRCDSKRTERPEVKKERKKGRHPKGLTYACVSSTRRLSIHFMSALLLSHFLFSSLSLFSQHVKHQSPIAPTQQALSDTHDDTQAQLSAIKQTLASNAIGASPANQQPANQQPANGLSEAYRYEAVGCPNLTLTQSIQFYCYLLLRKVTALVPCVFLV